MTAPSTNPDSNGIFWLPGIAPEEFGYPGFNPRTVARGGMVIEYDVTVPLRDDGYLYADVYRPADASDPVPVLLAWSAYGKHNPVGWEHFPGHEVELSRLSQYTNFEVPDAQWFAERGYALVIPDPRGTWNSPGDSRPYGPEEVLDACDVIEWAGIQPWSNGRVGMCGVSYFAVIQWFIAAQRPRHLSAINPWEGRSDFYRECWNHGGIPDTQYLARWMELVRCSRGRVEDLLGGRDAHPMLDSWWEPRIANLSQIDVPAYIVASWPDHGQHTRGTIEGFRQARSTHKYLEVHGQKKWAYFYSEESAQRQLLFYDRFLKGQPNEVDEWPPVRIEVRQRGKVGAGIRTEQEWPLARTDYRRAYLLGDETDDGTYTLGLKASDDATVVSYDAQIGEAIFDLLFEEDTELTGYMKLRLHVEADGSDDMDLFVVIQKLDSRGRKIDFPYFCTYDDGNVGLGWLRVSHRELDQKRSTDFQPWLKHREEQLLNEGQIAAVDIEIWPSSTLFEAGSTLRLVVQGRDFQVYDRRRFAFRHEDTRNSGMHRIHVGGMYDSHLLMPVIP